MPASSAAVMCLRTFVLDLVVAWSQRTSRDGFDSFSSKWFFHEEMTRLDSCETRLSLCDVSRFTAWPATDFSVLFFSRPRSEGWPHHEPTFSIYLYLLPFWLTLPWWVLSTSWCCPSRLCVVFLACVHLALFLTLSPFSRQLPCFLVV